MQDCNTALSEEERTRWTMHRVRLLEADFIPERVKTSCCVGCPHRQTCNTGWDKRYHVMNCHVLIEKQQAIEILSRVSGMNFTKIAA